MLVSSFSSCCVALKRSGNRQMGMWTMPVGGGGDDADTMVTEECLLHRFITSHDMRFI